MTREEFNRAYGGLVKSYIYSQDKVDQSHSEIYWRMFQHTGYEQFTEAVKEAILTCKFFPSVAEIADIMFPAKTERIDSYTGAERRVSGGEQLSRFNREAQKQIAGGTAGGVRGFLEGGES